MRYYNTTSKKVRIKICRMCGQEFITRYPNRLYCSRTCAYQIHIEQIRRRYYDIKNKNAEEQEQEVPSSL